MNLSIGQISLIDLITQLERREVIINRNYQRGAGVWPVSAQSYFIDTILEGYPFPKIYLYQVFSEKSKRPIKEIIDGQQRISTIQKFFENKLKLTSASKNFSGMHYGDLDAETQNKFFSYQIDISIVLSATRPELLEMFRRMNAYTAPLSAPESRHARYQGSFKWFVVERADDYSTVLEECKILTPKQINRMGDADFVSDLVLALEKGIVEKNSKNIEELYKTYDVKFGKEGEYEEKLTDFFRFLKFDLESLHETFMMKSYVVNTLFCAFIHAKYGLPKVAELTEILPNERIVFNLEKILPELAALAHAHEEQVESGPYAEYVKSCSSSTTKLAPRKARFQIILNVLVQ